MIRVKRENVLEKSKRVQVKPYQRKGKFVIGYNRLDPRRLGEPFKHTQKMAEAGKDYWSEPDTDKFLQALYKNTRGIEDLRSEGRQLAEDYRRFQWETEEIAPDKEYLERLEEYNKKFKEEYDKADVIYRGISVQDIDYAVMDILAGKPLKGDESVGTVYMTLHPATAGIFVGDIGEGYVYVLDKEKAEKNGQAKPVHYETIKEWNEEQDFDWEHGKDYTAALADEMEIRSEPIKNPEEVVKEIWIIGPNANKRMAKAQKLYPQFRWRIIPYEELDSLRGG